LCSRRYLLGTRIENARFGNAQAIIRCARAGATSMMGRVLACNAPNGPLSGGAIGIMQISE
jgi:hypothetical protein